MSGSGATETQNIAAVRRGYEAFAKGDIETLKGLFTADANWHSLRAGVLAGNYRGARRPSLVFLVSLLTRPKARCASSR